MRAAVRRRAGLGIAVATCLAAVPISGIGEPARDRNQLMQATLGRSNEDRIEGSVEIDCPVEKVFNYYRNFKNLPAFLGDVMAIEPVDSTTSRWTIQGPLRIRVQWTTRVTEERPDELIRYETVASPRLRTYWEIYFSQGPKAGETQVREVMKPPLGRLGRAGLALIGKYPAREVAANLRRLKQVLETGKVTDTSYAVRGKF